MMVFPRFMVVSVAVAGIATTGACSHEQKPPAAVPQAKVVSPRTPPPASERRLASAATPPATLEAKQEDPEIFFDFDSAALRDDARPTLQKVSDVLRRQRDEKLRIEGNCDQLGTVEYNLALGDHRARSAKEYLEHLGIPAHRITTVSYGSQRPRYPGSDETARSRNRRDDFIVIR